MKKQILQRAKNNGRKAAQGRRGGDESTAQFFQKDTDRLCNLYPEYRREIRDAHETAYKALNAEYPA